MSIDDRLRWGLKRGFIEYVRAIDDGQITVEGGARFEDGVFSFPATSAAGDHRAFDGSVTITAYAGMLAIRLSEVRLEEGPAGFALSILDPTDRSGTSRVRLCELSAADGTGRFRSTLAAEATRLFDGTYPPGAAFDDVEVGAAAADDPENDESSR